MSKARILLVLAIWLVVLPYLGFPYSWQDVLVSLTGLVLVYLGFLFYKNYKALEPQKSKEKTFDNFSENKNFENTDVVRPTSMDEMEMSRRPTSENETIEEKI